jgi:hypothetical protein
MSRECAHRNCHCSLEGTGRFCGAYCANAHRSDPEPGACSCGHDECQERARAASEPASEDESLAALGHRPDAYRPEPEE